MLHNYIDDEVSAVVRYRDEWYVWHDTHFKQVPATFLENSFIASWLAAEWEPTSFQASRFIPHPATCPQC